MVWLETIVSVLIISLISVIGLLTVPVRILRRHGVMFGLIALAAGTLIGDSFFHLLPEAVELWGDEFPLALGVLIVAGFLAFYALESTLRIGHAHAESHHEPHDRHHHAPAALNAAAAPPSLRTATVGGPTSPRMGAAPTPARAEPSPGLQPFGILNLVGDAVHNFLDGIVVAAAFLGSTELGIATAIAVAIHEIPQEFGDFGVLVRSGFKPMKAIMFNLMSAGFAILGAVMLLLLSVEQEAIEKYALPVVAGGFLYIAAADLVPELHHHTKPRYIPIVIGLLLIGLAIMFGLTYLEPEGAHAHP